MHRVLHCVCAQHLGKNGIICMEDLIHEIYTVGPKFKEASNFLYPFQLNSPCKFFSHDELLCCVVTRHCYKAGHVFDKAHFFLRLAA